MFGNRKEKSKNKARAGVTLLHNSKKPTMGSCCFTNEIRTKFVFDFEKQRFLPQKPLLQKETTGRYYIDEDYEIQQEMEAGLRFSPSNTEFQWKSSTTQPFRKQFWAYLEIKTK